MTHDELVERAARYLRNQLRCSVVVTEMVAWGSETPDALGWYNGATTLIECKATKSDWLADKKKYYRRIPERGLGYRRYYMVPREMEDYAMKRLPDKWGLLVVKGRSVFLLANPKPFKERAVTGEMGTLLSIIRRIAGVRQPLTGLNVRCSTEGKTNEGKATLFVRLPDEED